MKANFGFFSKETPMTLKHAICIYAADARSESPGPAHATLHDVDTTSGRPVIQPGRLATVDDLKALASGLSESMETIGTNWIDSKVLASGGGRMIWYTPAGPQSMFFQNCHFEQSFDAHGVAPVPALIWLAERDALFVFAVKDGDRPTQQTQLFQAPFFNVWARGQVCVGSAQRPSGNAAADPNAWERMFWGSRFTHPNFKQKDRLLLGVDPYDFWREWITQPGETFPLDRLVPLELKVADLLPLNATRIHLNHLRATGEF